MGQVRHGSATTTHAVRAAIQRSQASLATLSRDLGINPKTVAKWRKRQTVEDLKTGPREPRSTILTEAEEATIVAFRRHTLLPLDDCLYALQPSIPHLTRSALHRCLQRHGISRLPDVEGDKPKRQKFKRYPIGFFHIDIAEVQTATRPAAAAEMVLVRIAYVADLPTPDEVIRMIEQNGAGAAPATSGSAASSPSRGAPASAISAMPSASKVALQITVEPVPFGRTARVAL